MKEIKFRAWDHTTNNYFIPDTLYLKDGKYIYGTVCTGRHILEQYTGLKDKNGKEIYEGDIYRDSNGELRVVSFEEDIDTDRFWQFAVGWLFDFPNSGIEIIGNIHETPELLK